MLLELAEEKGGGGDELVRTLSKVVGTGNSVLEDLGLLGMVAPARARHQATRSLKLSDGMESLL